MISLCLRRYANSLFLRMINSLFFSHKNKKEGSKILNEELLKIADWLAANKLSLNVKKSKLLIFSNKHIVKDNNNTEESIAEVTDEFPEESEAGIYIKGAM